MRTTEIRKTFKDRLKDRCTAFLREERGMGTVEIILIIVVLIGLVIIFKKQLNDLVETIFGTITSKSNMVLGD